MKKINAYYLLITLIFFGILIKLEYATDTYAVFNFNQEAVYMQFAMSGRFVTAILFSILKIAQIPEIVIYFISWFVAIICATLCQIRLYKIIDIKNKVLKILIPTLTIINPFSIELFLYIEKGIMWFGILMCIFAIEKIIKYLENGKKKNIMYAIIFMTIANASYQGIIGIFISILLVYILKYKNFIKNNIIVGITYAIPAFLNYILVKNIYSESRINGEIVLIQSVKKIVENIFKMYKYTYNLLPQYLYLILILIVIGIIIYQKKNELLKIAYIVLGVTFVAIAPQIIQPTQSIWFVPRTTYCFASLYGILVLYACLNKTDKKVLILLSIFLLIFQFSKFIQIEKNRYELNKKDEQIAISIVNEIRQYEKQTQNYITELALYKDKQPNYTYEGIFATGDINVKSFAIDWSTKEILKYYLKRDIKLIKQDEKIKQKFIKENWHNFDKKQIIFENNKINLCNF